MSTGFQYLDHRMGGSVPGYHSNTVAGAVLTTLDYVFTTGPSPWTKTVEGTNYNSYQAPGGSQIKLHVDNQYTGLVSTHIEIWGDVGGTVFPTVAQRATQKVLARAFMNTAYPTGWYAVRTDRFAAIMFQTVASGSPNSVAGWLVAGDIPVLDPADAGLCVVVGTVLSSYPYGPGTNPFTVAGTSITGPYGFALSSKDGLSASVPVYCLNPFSSSNYQSTLYSDYNGAFPVSRWTVGTPRTAVPESSRYVVRGYIPFVYSTPFNQTGVTALYNAVQAADTFEIGGNTLELFLGGGSTVAAFMQTDGENLP